MSRTSHASLAALILLTPLQAKADFHVVSPLEIDLGEIEIEHNGSDSVDPNFGGQQSYTIELGTGLTPWWHSEIELGFDNDPGTQPTLLTQVVTENMFQLTEPGQRFADLGFYVEYGQSTTHGSFASSNELTFGPVISKDVGRTTHTMNLFLEKQLGPDQTSHGLDFTYAWQSRWKRVGAAIASHRILWRHRHARERPRILTAAADYRTSRGRRSQAARSRPRQCGAVEI
jgi:hypothetical protein